MRPAGLLACCVEDIRMRAGGRGQDSRHNTAGDYLYMIFSKIGVEGGGGVTEGAQRAITPFSKCIPLSTPPPPRFHGRHIVMIYGAAACTNSPPFSLCLYEHIYIYFLNGKTVSRPES